MSELYPLKENEILIIANIKFLSEVKQSTVHPTACHKGTEGE